MKKIAEPIPGLILLEQQSFKDERGWFQEDFSLQKLKALGIETPPLAQTNRSQTRAHTLRGLHFQAPPHGQAKLVWCPSGHLVDVAVDIRKGSPTYGQGYAAQLSDENHRALYVPIGFAHGFYAITQCQLQYAVFGAGYNKASEGGLRWNASGIDWEQILPYVRQWSGEPSANERDATFPSLEELVSPFTFELTEVTA